MKKKKEEEEKKRVNQKSEIRSTLVNRESQTQFIIFFLELPVLLCVCVFSSTYFLHNHFCFVVGLFFGLL